MPPLPLISSIAIRAPSRKLVEETAPAPDNSPMKAKPIGPDCASALPATTVANAAASIVFFIGSSPGARLLALVARSQADGASDDCQRTPRSAVAPSLRLEGGSICDPG